MASAKDAKGFINHRVTEWNAIQSKLAELVIYRRDQWYKREPNPAE